MKPLVSILITNYNYGRFLAEAVDSSLRQTYQPIETIVVDDGSTDNSRQVITALKSKYPQLTSIYQDNLGTVVAKRKAISLSHGKYFLHLDADDVLEPRAVELMEQALAKDTSAAYAYPKVQLFGTKTGVLPSRSFSGSYLAVRGNYICGSALVRRDDYDKTRGYDLAKGFEDWDLWLSFLDHGMKGVFVPQILLSYRQHSSSSRNSLSPEEFQLLEREIRQRHPNLYEQYATQLLLYRLVSKLKRIVAKA